MSLLGRRCVGAETFDGSRGVRGACEMIEASQFSTEALRSIGLAAMERSGRVLTRVASERRGQLYVMPDGCRVRLRTNNDRRVIVTTDDTRSDAKLDLDGCDFVLLVVPKQRRQRGPIEVYLVPFSEVQAAFATAHADWLASLPKTRGQNHTWQLFFDEGKPASAASFADKWRAYRIDI